MVRRFKGVLANAKALREGFWDDHHTELGMIVRGEKSMATAPVRRYPPPRMKGRVGRPLKEVDAKRLLHLYRSGAPVERVCRLLGISLPTLYKRLRRLGEPLRRRSKGLRARQSIGG